MVAQPTAPQRTVDALDALPDDERVELIDGTLVYETTSFEHGDAQSSLGGEIKSRFGGDGPGGGVSGWWIGSEVTVEYAATQAFRHDVAGWRKDRVPERPVGRRVRVRPDWVCEILSTNKRKDLVEKRAVLQARGVPHYWIVDLHVPLLTVLRLGNDGYVIAATVAPGETARVEPFEAVELDVARLFGDVEKTPR